MKTVCTKCSQEIEVPDDPSPSEVECPACHQMFSPAPVRPKIGIRKPGAIHEAPAPVPPPAPAAPVSDRPKIGIRKPGAAQAPAPVPEPAPAAPVSDRPKIGIRKPGAAAQAPAPAPEPKPLDAAPKPETPPTPPPAAEPKAAAAPKPAGTAPTLNLPKPGGAAPTLNLPKPGGAVPTLNLPKPGGAAPTLNLPKPGGAAPTLNLPKPGAAAAAPVPPKEPWRMPEWMKKAMIFGAVGIVAAGILAAGGFFGYRYLNPVDPVKQFEKGSKLLQEGKFEEAVKWWEKSAQQNNPDAIAALGKSYAKGEGVPADYAKALTYLEKTENDADAEYLLGTIYEEGKAGTKDPEKAFAFYQKAAARGNADAKAAVARCYGEGIGVEKDTGKALEWLKKQAQEGNPEAQVLIAERYLTGVELEFNPEEAMMLLTAAAEQKNVKALYLAGECWRRRLGIDPEKKVESEKRAEEYYKKAYETALELCMEEEKLREDAPADALTVAGKCCFFGYGTEKDPEKAMELLSAARKKNSPDAVILLARQEKNTEEVSAMLADLVKAENPEAMVMQAAIEWEKGHEEAAKELLERAKQLGSCEARIASAVLFPLSDPAEVLENCRYAAARKYIPGILQLGDCYEQGRGMDNPDMQKAIDCYWEAAYEIPSEFQAAAKAKLDSLCRNPLCQEDLYNRYKAIADQEKHDGMMGEEQKEAKRQIATYYLHGYKPVKRDHAEAVKLLQEIDADDDLMALLQKKIEVQNILSFFERKANEGNPQVQDMLASIYMDGKVVPADPQKGYGWLKKAAASGSASANEKLGEIFYQEDGEDLFERDRRHEMLPPDEDKPKIKESASSESKKKKAEAEAKAKLQFRREMEKIGAEYFKKAAELGDPQGMYRTAKYNLLRKKNPNPDETEQYLKTAAEAGLPEAAFLYAMVLLDKPGEKTQEERNVILGRIRQSAQKYAPAQFAMGEIAALAGNRTEADKWYQKAAKSRYLPAILALDRSKAGKEMIKWALRKEYLPAKIETAVEKTATGEKNTKELEELYREFPPAANNLGVCLATEAKKNRARELFQKAEKDGNPNATFNLAVLLYREDQNNTPKVIEMLKTLKKKDGNEIKIPDELFTNMEMKLKKEAEYRKLYKNYQDFLRRGVQKRENGGKTIKIDANAREKEEGDALNRRLKELNLELLDLSEKIRKDLVWKFDKSYPGYFHTLKTKQKYPWKPAVSLAPLKEVYSAD